MRRLWIVCLGLGLGACEWLSPPAPAELAEEASSGVAPTQEADAATANGALQEERHVPATRDDVLPSPAPDWVRTRAQVVESEEGRFLLVTGIVRHIENESLAKTAAANRARAEIAVLLDTHVLSGTEVVDTWRSDGVTAARVRIPVERDWQLPSEAEKPPSTAESNPNAPAPGE